ncbi:hypothetical protein [Wolbachia endosymbiont (group A) of Agelastica alni]|uniref:hypothetical protein n=1 Tax=Wolbachia endosymbiont (group A) of Agelastica alni TaxID=3066130 RepID=UPI00313343EB
MIRLTKAQQEILGSLRQAVFNGNFQEVQDVLDSNEHNDIQQVLKFRFLDKVLVIRTEEDMKIIALFWEVADQETRDFLCTEKVGNERALILAFEKRQKKMNTNQSLEQVIQKVKEHEKVMDLDSDLQEAIINLDVDKVKAALENCGEDVESVLERKVYWNSGRVDAFLVCPLKVKYSKELNQDDVKNIKEIFELMFNAASPQLLRFELNGNNYVMDKLTCAQKRFAKIPGVGEQCFQDLIQEFEENLSRDTLDNAKTDDQIAWDKEYATRFSQEINQDPSENDDLNFIDDTLGQDTVNSAPTTGNKTPEKNDTTFWSKHKGKIALGVTGLCVAGAVAAYVLAYPVVALVLAALATAILVGAGIAKVCEKVENPSADRVSDKNEQLLNQ